MTRLIILICSIFLFGCGTTGRPVATATLLPADIDALIGGPWVGTLTYLDYTSHKLVTIDSSLVVRRTGQSPPSWEFGVGYSKEPHADTKEVIALSVDGSKFGDEMVVSRSDMPGGGVKFITESEGEDDHKPAQFRFEHEITPVQYTRRKLVQFKGERGAWIERHVYQLKRVRGG